METARVVLNNAYRIPAPQREADDRSWAELRTQRVFSRTRILVTFWFAGPLLAGTILPHGLGAASLALTLAAAGFFSRLATATVPKLACPQCRCPSFPGAGPSLDEHDGCASCGIRAPQSW